MATSDSSSRFAFDTRMRSPFKYAPAPALGRKHLVPSRIVNDPGDQLSGFLQTDRHVVNRESVGEIRRSVQRIDVPAILGVPSAARRLPLATIEWSGNAAVSRSTISFSDAWSAAVTRSCSPFNS